MLYLILENMHTQIEIQHWLKTNSDKVFLQKRWIYLRLLENWNLESATMASHVQFPTQRGKENALWEKTEVGRARVNRVHSFPWVSLWEERRLFFFLLDSAVIAVFQLYLFLFSFYISSFDKDGRRKCTDWKNMEVSFK